MARPEFRCTCDLACAPPPSEDAFDPLCPFHLMADLFAERAKRNLSPDHALFPSEDGSVTTRKAVIESLKVITGQSNVTEHSPRRSGAQWLARCGLPLWKIQFLGRWGSETVRSYVEEAFVEVAADFAREARVGRVSLDMRPAAGASSASGPPALSEATTVREHLQSFGEILHNQLESWSVQLNVLNENSRSAGQAGPRLVCRPGSGKLVVHWVQLGESYLPPEAWRAACGWKFGFAPHARRQGVEALVTCKPCRHFLGLEPTALAGRSVVPPIGRSVEHHDRLQP